MKDEHLPLPCSVIEGMGQGAAGLGGSGSEGMSSSMKMEDLLPHTL
jgi:hypothetical protein